MFETHNPNHSEELSPPVDGKYLSLSIANEGMPEDRDKLALWLKEMVKVKVFEQFDQMMKTAPFDITAEESGAEVNTAKALEAQKLLEYRDLLIRLLSEYIRHSRDLAHYESLPDEQLRVTSWSNKVGLAMICEPIGLANDLSVIDYFLRPKRATVIGQ